MKCVLQTVCQTTFCRGLSVVDRGGETVTDSDQPAQDPADPGLATATGLYKLSFVSWDTEGHDWDRKGVNQKTGAGLPI